MHQPLTTPRVEDAQPRQAHADIPAQTYERELGREGFYGPASHMLHSHPPTGWVAWDGPLRPRAYDLTKLAEDSSGPWAAPAVLSNAHVVMRFWRTAGAMPRLARNGDGDELLFVHTGAGHLFCDYGHLAIGPGDYVVVPRGTMWRTEFDGAAEVVLIEATNEAYGLPDKGIVGRHAVFDPAILETPRLDDPFRAQQGEDPWQVEIKRAGQLSTVTYPYNPLDAVAWQGDLAPVKLNWRDIRPLMSHRAHLPPSAHTTFVAPRFVICTFVPRPFETDPGALKVPFFHNNDDYDEAIFYHQGKFFSRDNINAGSLTFHPAGFTHGPHPKALKNAFAPAAEGTDEVALMIDTRDPLTPGNLPAGVEDEAYVDSWRTDEP